VEGTFTVGRQAEESLVIPTRDNHGGVRSSHKRVLPVSSSFIFLFFFSKIFLFLFFFIFFFTKQFRRGNYMTTGKFHWGVFLLCTITMLYTVKSRKEERKEHPASDIP
jgi:hypothetical protein